jgi:hypothetical protein
MDAEIVTLALLSQRQWVLMYLSALLLLLVAARLR